MGRTGAPFCGLQPSVIWQSPNFLILTWDDGNDCRRGDLRTEMGIQRGSLVMVFDDVIAIPLLTLMMSYFTDLETPISWTQQS